MDRQTSVKSFDIDEHRDPCDFLGKTVFDSGDLAPIGFIRWKPRVRVKAVTRRRDDMPAKWRAA